MRTFFYKVRKRLYSYYLRVYYIILGLYFDFIQKTYKTNGLSFEVPKSLTTRITRGYFAEGKIEVDEQYLVKKHVAPQATVLELGANLGVVSSVVNRMLTNPENQVVVEANPTIIPYLEANKKNNHCAFHIENCIVSDQKETLFFFGNSISSGGIINKNDSGKQQAIKVKGVTLADLQEKHHLTFDTLVMDIEGAEYNLLKEIEPYLPQFQLIIFEQHPTILDSDQLQEIDSILERNNFSTVDESGDTVVWKKMTAS